METILAKKRRIVFVVLGACALLAVATVAFWPEPKEPEYQGKKLSEWAEIYRTSFNPVPGEEEPPKDSAERREAVQAAHYAQAKLLPRAVDMIRYEKPEWKTAVEHFMEVRLNVRSWCPNFIWFPFYEDKGEDNMVYFEMLGPDASPAVPELAHVMSHAESSRVRERAMFALSCIGKEGLGPLMAVLGDSENPDRRRVVYALLDMRRRGGDPSSAVPLLVRRLKDPDPNVCSAAAMILGELGLEPDIAIPALVSCVKGPDEYLRESGADALAKFGDKARYAVPSLLNALRDRDSGVRDSAIDALQRIAPEVLKNGVSGAHE